MSKIAKWNEARKTHEELVQWAGHWSRREDNTGPLMASRNHPRMVDTVTRWLDTRKAELYRDMIAFSGERLADAAREALAECEQIREDAAMDVDSIEEGR